MSEQEQSVDKAIDIDKDKNKFDFAKHHHNYFSDYIKFADVKAVGIFGINSLIIRLIFPYLNNNLWDTITFLCLLGSLSLMLGISFSILVILPRTTNKPEKGLIFWENVSAYKKEDYIKDLSEIGEKDLIEKMFEQNYFLSIVATKKYAVLRKAFIFSSTGLFIMLLAGLFWLFK